MSQPALNEQDCATARRIFVQCCVNAHHVPPLQPTTASPEAAACATHLGGLKPHVWPLMCVIVGLGAWNGGGAQACCCCCVKLIGETRHAAAQRLKGLRVCIIHSKKEWAEPLDLQTAQLTAG
jgi:hypothetical protein